MPELHKAAVIGLGNIGMQYDFEDSSGAILTHANAFASHPAFELVGAVSPDPAEREQFEKKFGATAFANLEQLFSGTGVDALSIGVPTDLHEPVITEVMSQGPKGLLLEKPMGKNAEETARIAGLFDESTCVSIVNYFRRCEPGTRQLADQLDRGELGKPLKANVWYGKGLRNNASHLIDLMTMMLGEVTECWLDRPCQNQKDPEPDFSIDFNGVTACFRSWPDQLFSTLGFELYCENARVRYDHGGQEISVAKVTESPLFPARRILDRQAVQLETDFARYQWHVMDALAKAMQGLETPVATPRSAIEVSRTIDKVYKLNEKHR